jgi:hypothetical protein
MEKENKSTAPKKAAPKKAAPKNKIPKVPFEVKERKKRPPVKWTPDALEKSFSRILNHLASDLMPIVKACQQSGEMNYTKFYEYINEDPLRAERYAQACDDRAEMIFEKMKEIAENPEEGVETMINDKTGVTITRKDQLGHRRLVVDTYKWTLSKLKPKKYGDRNFVNMEAEIKDERIDTSKLNTEELLQLKKIYDKARSGN